MSGEELRAAAQGVDAGWSAPVERGQWVPIYGEALVRLRAALAAPSTPEPSGHDWRDHSSSPHRHAEDSIEPIWDRAAPSTEPARDPDTLVVAMLEAVKGVALRHGINPTEFLDAANAAANAVRRLADSQP